MYRSVKADRKTSLRFLALLSASPSVKAHRARDLRRPGIALHAFVFHRMLKSPFGISLLYFDAPSVLNKST
ncbi:hypothetical protein [Caballeronia ptereochthonis]|uniref:hypothetical protein n=1 Tax=Caballeronia ptereochthonis TaxID=1777144 RepID=UPI00117E4DFE|nr:hypothetical protein [Caballeronia ptereochthonis]